MPLLRQCLLRRLVATTEQNDHFVTALNKVGTIAWAVENPHFRNAAPYARNVSKVARGCPVQSLENSGLRAIIAEPRQPSRKASGLPNLENLYTIVCNIPIVNHGKQSIQRLARLTGGTGIEPERQLKGKPRPGRASSAPGSAP